MNARDGGELRRLADEAAIEKLVHRYAFLVRSQRGGECGGLFVPDGVFETGMPRPGAPGEWDVKRLEGRDAIAAYVGAAGGGDARVFPAIDNLMIDVDGDAATANCLMRVVVVPGGTELLGEYDDGLVRYDGRWLFAERRYRVHWSRRA